MYLGRIITKSKTVETVDFVDITSDKTLAIDCSIPTLVIGKKNIQDIVGVDNVHFLDKHINTNLSWTFAKTEQRNEYEKDLKNFNKKIINKLINDIEYKFFNIFTLPFSVIKAFIKFMYGNKQKVIYQTNNMLYIYCENIVYGISLTDLNYIGIKKDKMMSKIKSNQCNKVLNNDYFLTKSLKKFTNKNKMIVPYVFFLQST